jgi:DNA polymerase-3 subunit chi
MTGSCQVDFYVLGSHSQTAGQLACRLAMMAWEQGHKIAVLAENSDEAQKLDELMWEYPAGRFLPHSTDFGDSSVPIRICTADQAATLRCEVIINLSSFEVPAPERFQRLLEIVPCSESERSASRKKFVSYRNQGLQPANHTIGK